MVKKRDRKGMVRREGIWIDRKKEGFRKEDIKEMKVKVSFSGL